MFPSLCEREKTKCKNGFGVMLTKCKELMDMIGTNYHARHEKYVQRFAFFARRGLSSL